MMITLFLLAITSILSIWFLHLVGYTIRYKFRSKNIHYEVLSNIVIGLLFTVITYSLIITNLKSVHISVIPLALGVLLLFPKQLKKQGNYNSFLFENYFNELVLLMKYTPVFLLLFFIQLYKWEYFSNAVFLGIDEPLYVTISEFLNMLGIENTRTFYNGLLENPINYVQPYHYTDLWFNALLFKVFTWLPPIYIYQFCFIPLLLFLLFLSYLMIAELTNKVRLYNIILAISFLFLIGFFPYSKIGINGLEFHNAPIFNNPKTLPSYLALSYSLKYIISNNYKSAVITLLILPIINILYIALIPPIAFLFIIYLFLNRLITKQDLVRLVSLLSIVVISIGLFYLIFGHNNSDFASVDMGYNLDWNYIKKSIHAIFRVQLTRPIYYIFFFLLIVVFYKHTLDTYKHIKHFIALILLFMSTGILLSGILHAHRESWQLVANTMIPSLYIVFFYYISRHIDKVFENRNYKHLIIYGFITLQIIISINITIKPNGVLTSKQFITKLKHSNNSINGIGVFFATHKISFDSEFMSAPQIAYFADFVKLINNNTWLVSLSIPLPSEIDSLKFTNSSRFIKESPFYKYVENQIKINTFNSRAISQASFIKTKNIKFAVIQEGVVLPIEVKKLIRCSYYDDASGTKVAIFK